MAAPLRFFLPIGFVARMTSHSPYPDTFELEQGAFAMLAPAKINLRLKVLGKRADGFHELDTLFQEISLADRLEFHPSQSWSLEIRGMDMDNGESNLVTRAARLLSKSAGVPCRAHVVVHKLIPSGGGLGGGSSDASITLLGLSRLWGLGWSEEQLHSLGMQLGSDCAFFLYGGLAHGQGRGEVIELLEDKLDKYILLIIPPFGIPTAEVYSWSEFPLTRSEKSVILQSWVKKQSTSLSNFEIFCNDLESLVLNRYEDLLQIKKQLLDSGADGALLSGSGSCIFAAFSDRSRALRAAQHFRDPYQAVITQTVSRPRRRG